MKQILALVGIMLVLVIGYLLVSNVSRAPVTEDPDQATEMRSFASEDFGFSFEYPSSYTLATPGEIRGDLVFVRSLIDADAYKALTESTTPREGPPAISVAVYRNPMNLDLEEWIRETPEANFALVMGELGSERIGGTTYVTYTRDGLYTADVYAHARAGYVYLISAEYADAESAAREDVRTILESISWSEPRTAASVAHGDIVVTSPRAGEAISSPLEIRGEARGMWFFEASFPVVLVDWDGLIIAESFATADGEWMTEDFVGFTATLEFETPEFGERGALILQKDNPSGLPENDDAIEIPITFE